RAADPSRPVFANFGQGVAWDRWHGRGIRTNRPEDYPEYVKAADIVSFDIYPVGHPAPEVAGRLEYVARGVRRLRGWARDGQAVWSVIGTSRVLSADAKPTPADVRAMVWMALVSGARGIVYFVHQLQPVFIEAALLSDPEMLAAVTAINRRIAQLAPALNSPDIADAVRVEAAVPIAAVVRRSGGRTFLFAVSLRPQAGEAEFRLTLPERLRRARLLDEDRSLPVADGRFRDAFPRYGVHLYELE
ncbi:MAG: hypothetical protein AB7H93_25225, partial [Vicinamibacterales bacterium]